MRVAIITPYYCQAGRGNAVTVRRIERNLGELGCETGIFSLDVHNAESLLPAVRSFSPDIIHAFHAVRSGMIASALAKELLRPYMITITGTDLYREDGAGFTPEEKLVFHNATALIVFHDVIAEKLAGLFPRLNGCLKIIPQGVTVPSPPEENRESCHSFNFLLPAGIRPVKNVLFCLNPLEKLWCRYPQIRFLLAGPVLESSYGDEVQGAIAAAPFASWLGEVNYAAMPALYKEAQVVLNSSLSEGGMANSLLEGMAYGKPVMATNIEGNRSLILDHENGLLFSSEEEFTVKAEKLLLDSQLRRRLGAAGRDHVAKNCSGEIEARSYLKLYRHVLKGS